MLEFLIKYTFIQSMTLLDYLCAFAEIIQLAIIDNLTQC